VALNPGAVVLGEVTTIRRTEWPMGRQEGDVSRESWAHQSGEVEDTTGHPCCGPVPLLFPLDLKAGSKRSVEGFPGLEEEGSVRMLQIQILFYLATYLFPFPLLPFLQAVAIDAHDLGHLTVFCVRPNPYFLKY